MAPPDQISANPAQEMESTISRTFDRFFDMPIELQILVWEQAALALPVLDIQHFTAEIIPSQQQPSSLSLVLCFTPHSDFISLTSGHRALQSVSKRSQEATRRILYQYRLPIYWVATGAGGLPVCHHAVVPFNPASSFCISGLHRAFVDACQGRGARGSQLQPPTGVPRELRHIMSALGALELPMTSMIQNLTFALDPLRLPIPSPPFRSVHDWVDARDEVYSWVLAQFRSLETFSLIGDSALDRRHHIDQSLFQRMLRGCSVTPDYQPTSSPNGLRAGHSWASLWRLWKRQQILHYVITMGKIDEIDELLSQSSDASDSVDIAANTAMRQELEINARAVRWDEWSVGGNGWWRT